jgi:hypothetical protein
LGKNRPVQDARLTLDTQYTFEPGSVTRTDRYASAEPLEIKEVTLDFASFSDEATLDRNRISFARGDVTAFEVSGMDACKVEKTVESDQYKSPSGPMKTRVSCRLNGFRMKDPLTIQWTLKYR